MHYYKKNIGDYHKKAGRLTMLQHGAYTLLLDSCYDREIFPTLEQAIEWSWAGSKDEIEAVEFVLKRFFTLEEGVYVQKRIQVELDKFHETSATNKRIAQERETKRKKKATKRAPSVDVPPPNHKPLTTNQEPGTINQEPKDKTISPDGSSIEIDQPDLIGDLDSYSKNDMKNKMPKNWAQSLIDAYHECLPDWPRVEIINDDRKKASKRAWKFTENSNTIEFWKGMFSECKGNAFMEGDNDRGWKGNFDYLLTNKTMVKIYEGNQPR